MGVNNTNLHKAKQAKNDEFYTQLSDVSEELKHYRKHFEGKVVFCNCDDPEYSAFWKYFHLNFAQLGLKKLISTHYDKEKSTYKMEYEGGDDNNTEVGVKTPLEGNGDFRNEECIELLKEADIVVTNPPFSEYRNFLAQLMKYEKSFIVWSNNNSITYKEVFPLLKENKMWLGYLANKTCYFQIPDSYEKWDEVYTKKMNDGHHYGKVPAISVFTNLDIPKRHEELILWKEFKPEDYPRYDNYMAFNVDKVSEIPKDDYFEIVVSEEEYKQFKDTYGDDCELVGDCNGKYKIKIYRPILGVPITFMDTFNPEQFIIVGADLNDLVEELGIKEIGDEWIQLYKKQGGRGHITAKMHSLIYTQNGKAKSPYKRVLVRKRRCLNEKTNDEKTALYTSNDFEKFHNISSANEKAFTLSI